MVQFFVIKSRDPLSHMRQTLQPTIEQSIQEAFERQMMSNRGRLIPFRLPALAQEIACAFCAATSPTAEETCAVGRSLQQQGLGFPALLEAQSTVLLLLAATEDQPTRTTIMGEANQFFCNLTRGFVENEIAESERQRDLFERALMNAVSQNRIQEAQFQHTLSELSTPIVPVYEGILVLPLVGSINRSRASEITERLLEAIAANQAEIVIIDITGVPVIDTDTANHLITTTRAANLLGSQVVLVGIGAEIAQTIVHLDIDLHRLVTLANLQSGIAYALRRLNRAIRPLMG